MAFYIAPWDACCLVPIETIGDRKSIFFRQELPILGQVKGTNLIRDYSFDKILCVETLHDGPKLNNEHGQEKVRTTMRKRRGEVIQVSRVQIPAG